MGFSEFSDNTTRIIVTLAYSGQFRHPLSTKELFIRLLGHSWKNLAEAKQSFARDLAFLLATNQIESVAFQGRQAWKLTGTYHDHFLSLDKKSAEVSEFVSALQW